MIWQSTIAILLNNQAYKNMLIIVVGYFFFFHWENNMETFEREAIFVVLCVWAVENLEVFTTLKVEIN